MSEIQLDIKGIPNPEFTKFFAKFKAQCNKYLNSKYLTVLIVAIGFDHIIYYTTALTDTRFHERRKIKTSFCDDLAHLLTHHSFSKNDEIEPPVTFNFEPNYDYFLVGKEKLSDIK